MNRLLVTLVALVPAACLPPPKDAGEAESSGTEDTGGEPTSTGSGEDPTETEGEPAEADIEWTLELEPDRHVVRMIRTPNGVLVGLQGDPAAPEPYAEVREYSSTMELSWSQPLPNAAIEDLEDLGDGEYLVAGVSGDSGSFEPTLWRMSCCSAPVSQTYPHPSEYTRVFTELRGDDVLLVLGIDDLPGDAETAFLQIPLDLGPATDLGTETLKLYQTARTSTDTVSLLIDAGDSDMIAEYGSEGYTGGIGLGHMVMVGKGDELTLMRLLEDAVEIQAFGADVDEWVSAPIPGFAAAYDSFAVDRHERVVLVHMEEEGDGSSSYLVEFDDAGVVARSLTLPHVQYDYSNVQLVAVGEDDAIYVAMAEGTPGVGYTQYLHRIAPLE